MTQTNETARRTTGHGAVGTALRRVVLFAAPLGAAVAMWLHPHAGDDVYDNVAPVVDTWLAGHLLLFPSLALVGVGLYLLVSGHRDLLAAVARAGIVIYAAGYLAFVAIVGIGTGLLVRQGQTLPAEQQAGVAEVVQYLHTSPTLLAAAAIGGVGYLLAVSAISVVLRRSGAPIGALVALVGSTIALGAHSGLVAVIGMALFIVAAAWLEFSRSH